jgi:hypothetical protein
MKEKELINWKELFALFCEKEDGICQWMMKPFINKATGDVWATDGHIVLILDKEFAGSDFEEIDKPLQMPFILDESKWKLVTAERLREALEQCDREEIVEKEEVECPECNGDGVVEWEYHSSYGDEHWHTLEHDCPVCDGEGYIYKDKKTGRFDIAKGTGVSIGFGQYSARLMARILKAMELLEVDGFRVISTPEHNRMVLFDFGTPQVRVGLMPMICDKKVIDIDV